MLRAVLLLLVVVGIHARPLQDVHRLRKSEWKIKGPQLVQDELKEDTVQWKSREPSHHSKLMKMNTEENHNSVPVEERRQGTEPSRRFLMDLNTGMLKEEVGEMNRRVAGYYNPSAYEIRQGTQKSHMTLVDPVTGQRMYPLTEMQRSTAPLDEYRQGTEYRPQVLKILRMRDILRSQFSAAGEKHEQREVSPEIHHHGIEPSRNILMDLNAGQLKEKRNEMDNKAVGSKWEVVSGPDHEQNHELVPVEERRQGTEPSRRFLMDLNTGMLKEEVGEMNRRVAGYYNPSPYEIRQGTQKSHMTLVDPVTGQRMYPLTEMQRSTAPLDEFRQGTEYRPQVLKILRMRDILRSQYSAAGEKHEQREVSPEIHHHADRWEVMAGSVHEGKERQQSSGHEVDHKAVPVEERRQGTEPSRRFLMDLNTGMLKEEVGEMNRRVAGYYNPSPYEIRQGTQKSQLTLVDPVTGQRMYPLTEMQRSTAPLDEFRQGTEYRPQVLKILRMRDILRSQYSAAGEKHEQREVSPEILHHERWEVMAGSVHEGKQRQQSSGHEVDHIAVPVEERRQGTEPSRRFLMDLNTGMLKEEVGEMNRRVAGYYNPSPYEIRQGTQKSQLTLVDPVTGQRMYPLTEMQRSTAPLDEFRQGTEYRPQVLKILRMRDILRSQFSAAGEKHEQREVSPEIHHHEMPVAVCQGEMIQGRCYNFNPTPQTFNEAEASCKKLSSEGHLASVPNADVHKQLVTMVAKAKKAPVLTWLGGIQKKNKFQWIDGTSWGYSDWMPNHPQKHTMSCLEMFRFDESWWTEVDCGQQRAFICSYPMTA
nr:uncharacterized protein wu:fa56d06 isoform X2 [Misgurnus anguillicaudatus]